MELENKRVLVVGTGLSGMGAARLLNKVKAQVVLLEENEKASQEEIRKKLPAGVLAEIKIGNLEDGILQSFDLAVLSPGVPLDIELVKRLKEFSITIWGEMELAYRFSKGTLAAITGTNGKTTTTALTGEILKTMYSSVYVVGNIGRPFSSIALDTGEDSVIAAEVSSFQLETVEEFCPKVSAILNITPDHLNRHHTMKAYIEAKLAITKNQRPEDYCVLNYEDEELRKLGERLKCRVIYFSSKTQLEQGFYLDRDRNMVYKQDGQTEILCHVSECKLLGNHNYENILAGAAIGTAMGVPLCSIRKAITSFEAVEHRIEYVATRKGVAYYNDSKGTNPDAAIKGIGAMERATLLIGGGYDKDSSYDEWIKAFDGKVKKLVLIGQTREKIKEAANRCGFYQVELADSLEEAVELCRKSAVPGDAVLLSPACASWGMFDNYQQRGDRFKELVGKMED